MAETKMRLVDWLDDLCVRFIINLPQEELESVERICFQVEEAQWFYEDFIRPLDPTLPSLNLKQFCLAIFQHCPLFANYTDQHYAAAYSEFLAYKIRVPVRGAILLNEAMDEVVLVKGWKKGARWSFPRGKINKDENDLDCAIREVYEETGFDARASGIVKEESEMKFIEVSMREQHMRLYVFRGVPSDTYFEPRTRKEISKIQWYKLSSLPTLKRQKQMEQTQGHGEDLLKDNMFYMVAPFLGPLKNWIRQQKSLDRTRKAAVVAPTVETDVEETTADEGAAIAEGLTAEGLPEEPAQSMPDEHLSRLFANLRQSRMPDMSNLPEVHTTTEPQPDPAAELKRLLSVGGSMRPPQQTTPATNPEPAFTGSLLAMLQGPSGGQSLPRTPFEQISSVAPEPASPHHHHPRHPHFSAMPPPPQFPYSPREVNVQLSLPRNGSTPQMHEMRAPSVPNFKPPRIPNPQMHNHPNMAQHPRYMSQQNFNGAHQHAPGIAPRPYHRTGDPDFSGLPRFQGPTIPSASRLPPPKLTPHTMGLLNVFKSPSQGAPAKPAIKPFKAAADIYGSQAPETSSPLSNAVPISSTAPVTSNNTFSNAHASEILPVAKPRSAQQDALLNMFKSPAASAPTAVQQSTPAQLQHPGPVELSATPSPSLARKSLGSFDTQVNRKAPSLALNTLNQTKPSGPGLTAATVSGPMNAPDFEKVHRSRAKAAPEATNGRGSIKRQSRSNGKATPPAQPQVTILTRPRPANSPTPIASRAPPAPPPAAVPEPSPKPPQEPPKPFAPQILRRGQQLPEAPKPASHLQTQQSFDRRGSSSNEQKNQLLSLFGMPNKTASPSPYAPIPGAISATGFMSPVSPLPERQNPLELAGARSRISSVASSAHAEMPFGGIKMPKSARGSFAETGASPVTSPADKGFLLGYLNGVVQGGK